MAEETKPRPCLEAALVSVLVEVVLQALRTLLKLDLSGKAKEEEGGLVCGVVQAMVLL